MPKRHDCHRPSAIVPADYEFELMYHLATQQDGWPIPPFNMEAVIALQVAVRRDGSGIRMFGCPGQCGVCGTGFIYGEIWRHVPSGDIVHMGHQCAHKYGLFSDFADGKRQQARHIAREVKRARRDAFLADFPGLREALALDHSIINDIADRFDRTQDISDKQVALVMKIADEIRNPKPPEEHCEAPIGRVDFTGQVVSVKEYDSEWGRQVFKLTVKVWDDEGRSWLAWGTCPRVLESLLERGDRVDMRATLKQGRDKHFAIMSRPMGVLANYLPDRSTYTGKKGTKVIDEERYTSLDWQ